MGDEIILMGNHEFCTSCGEDDFHRGSECNPETKRKYQEELQQRRERSAAATKRMEERLKAAGIKYQLTEHGHAMVYKWDNQ